MNNINHKITLLSTCLISFFSYGEINKKYSKSDSTEIKKEDLKYKKKISTPYKGSKNDEKWWDITLETDDKEEDWWNTESLTTDQKQYIYEKKSDKKLIKAYNN